MDKQHYRLVGYTDSQRFDASWVLHWSVEAELERIKPQEELIAALPKAWRMTTLCIDVCAESQGEASTS